MSQNIAELLANFSARPLKNAKQPDLDQYLVLLDNYFEEYLTPPLNPPRPKKSKAKNIPVKPTLKDLLNSLIMRTRDLERNRDASERFAETKAEFPKGNLLLTEALVNLITRHGLTDDYTLNEKAISILKDPSILNLAHENNNALIYGINAAIKKRKQEDESLETENKFKTVLSNRYLVNAKDQKVKQRDFNLKLSHAASSLTSFLYFVNNPSDEHVMEKELDIFLKSFTGFVGDFGDDEVDVIRKVYRNCIENNPQKWYFLDTIYSYYAKQGKLALDNFRINLERKKFNYDQSNPQVASINHLITDLHLVSKTHLKMDRKTQIQAIGMMVGGFAFGMEIGMLTLENLALMSVMGPWGVLGVSLAACIALGTGIALYFHSAHYDELEKHNRFSYFHKHSNQTVLPEQSGWGTFIAKLGTVEEGVAAACLLATLGAFMVFDMVAWGVVGGNYSSAIPGWFFINSCPHIALTIMAGVALFAACAWVASCLASAHFALDGKHTIEYYNNKTEQKDMRQVINKETAAPLVFNWKSRISHQFEANLPEIELSVEGNLSYTQ